MLRPRSGGSGCSGSMLVRSETLCFPSVCSDREMPSEVAAGTGERISIDSTSVAQPDMVSNSSDQAHRPSDLVARYQEDHHESSGRDTPTDRARQPVPGRLQSFRTSIQEQGISDESFRIITILTEDQSGSIQLFVVYCRGCLMNAPQHPDTIRYGMYL